MSFPAYPKHKDSGVEWLGEIPEHWPVVSVGYRYEVALGKMLDAKQITGQDLAPYLRNADVQWGRINVEALSEMDFNADEQIRFSLRKGDLLVCEGGEIGRCAIWEGQIEECYYQKALHRLRPYDSRRDHTPYFRWLLEAAVQGGYFSQGETKATIAHLPAETLRRYRFGMPSPDEQRAIAEFLDQETARIDELVAEQQRLVELLQEKRQAVISHAVTKGLNPDVPMKDSGVAWLGKIPEHWRLARLKLITSLVTSGPRGWSERISEEGPIFVQSGDLSDGMTIDFEGAKRVSISEDAEAARSELCAGDVVVCITGAKTGNVAVAEDVPERAFINQHVCLIRPGDEVHPMFLGFTLGSAVGQTHFALTQYGLKQGLSLEDVQTAPVPLPSAAEQIQITAHLLVLLARFDALVADVEQAIALLRERRSALISAAVTGKIDVRSAATQPMAVAAS